MITYEDLAETFPPGDVIKEELEERGWSQRDLAEIMGVQPSVVSALIKGTKPISLDLARNLAAAFGNNAQFWVNMDAAYRLNLVTEKHTATTARSELYEVAPVNEMIKRGWIESSTDVEVLKTRILQFYDYSSLSEIEQFELPYAARQSSDSDERPTVPQKAWIRRVQILAKAVHVSHKFKEDRISELLASLKRLMGQAEEVRHVPKTLADFGIRFLIVEHIGQTRIDGVCLWLDQESPVIALSMRYDRLDYFWFTLLHEIGHVANKDGFAIDSDLVGERAKRTAEKSEVEQRADNFATETLISAYEINSFIARVKPLFSKVKINGFALRLGVHPAIVIGQLQHRGAIHWSHSREFLVKVRETITASTLTDGWGQILPNIA